MISQLYTLQPPHLLLQSPLRRHAASFLLHPSPFSRASLSFRIDPAFSSPPISQYPSSRHLAPADAARWLPSASVPPPSFTQLHLHYAALVPRRAMAFQYSVRGQLLLSLAAPSSPPLLWRLSSRVCLWVRRRRLHCGRGSCAGTGLVCHDGSVSFAWRAGRPPAPTQIAVGATLLFACVTGPPVRDLGPRVR